MHGKTTSLMDRVTFKKLCRLPDNLIQGQHHFDLLLFKMLMKLILLIFSDWLI